MELLLLFIGVPVLIGVAAAIVSGGLAVFGAVTVAVVSLCIRFWYFVLAVMLVILAPIIYLNGWTLAVLSSIAIIALVFYFIPLSDEQKAELEQLKLSVKR